MEKVEISDFESQIFKTEFYTVAGAAIIRMMENFLTSKVFRKGLSNYLNSRYKIKVNTLPKLFTYIFLYFGL